MSRPLSSTCNPANNILLKITVPKRTGRKRKRGSNEPFTGNDHDASAGDCGSIPSNPPSTSRALSARALLRQLQDSVGKYEVEAVGRIERMHVFRGMPDFVYSTTSSPFMTKFREKVLPFRYDKLKEFQFDMTKGSTTNIDIIPPPALSRGDVPFNYLYRQNPTVKQSIGPSGEITTTNTQQIVKVLTHLVACDVPSVPTGPSENCPPIHTLDQTLRETISILQSLFETRVAWTRRGLRNHLATNEQKYALRLAVPYVGYIFRSGPWRDAIVKFGHDPRLDPSSCVYQTFMFRTLPSSITEQLDNDNGNGNGNDNNNNTAPAPANQTTTITTSISNRRQTRPRLSSAVPAAETTPATPSHIFTGQAPLPRDGKMWMICDITDPILARLLSPPTPAQPSPSAEPTSPTPAPSPWPCDILSSGWYGNVTLAVAKTIMRAKIQHMLETGTTPPAAMEADFAPLLAFPARVGGDAEVGRRCAVDATAATKAGQRVSARCLSLAAEVRAMVRGAPGRKVFLDRGRMGGVGGGGGGGGERDGGGEEGERNQAKKVKWDDEAAGGGEEEGEEDDEEGEEEGQGEEDEEEDEGEEEDDDVEMSGM
ncbi:transcription factor tfiiic complex a box associated subunit sfc1 [Histoplasma capsulatum G186AR]|uniref:Transcription factor tfiiic complex a box associated subunit sfc1 n=2 Tax=Ajellomyces capsulatus TaxID=5037 RepID=C0NTB8_AJECG|nr:transcription factor tfiiic complex a box associated subunit sfc1 [Histoplasma capsulatum G186AR]EEH05279.1 transcription factor tfiiic complex a box associated subunit sfc1 [Histoplasma capsulatum G186AR]